MRNSNTIDFVKMVQNLQFFCFVLKKMRIFLCSVINKVILGFFNRSCQLQNILVKRGSNREKMQNIFCVQLKLRRVFRTFKGSKMTSGDIKAVKINLRDIKICLKELNIHEISIRLYWYWYRQDSWNYNFTFTIRGKNTVIFKEMN